MARLALRVGARPALGVGGVVEEVHVQVAVAVVVEKHGLGGVAGEVESILLGAVGEGAVAVVDVQDVVAVHREIAHGGDVDVQAPVAVDVGHGDAGLPAIGICVAVGDVDGDGLPDLYFTSNVGPNRLYRNLGNYRVEDGNERARVADPDGWKAGVTMADVNGDGRLGIYVSAMSYLTMHGHNVLYINNGDGTFTDRTKEYGLDFAGYSTQAVFFDYDGDGDLDMYLLNYSTHAERGPSTHPQREPRHPRSGDRLFRNDGGHFVDVSEQAHIYGGVEGYGLGVVATDVNLDGCPDLYVANDFQENDFLYINNCDGTFTESIARAVGHTSHASMGVDAADY